MIIEKKYNLKMHQIRTNVYNKSFNDQIDTMEIKHDIIPTHMITRRA